ncbi:MAG: EcsC family protein [Marmoricola sp.]
MNLSKRVGRTLAPKVTQIAPGVTAGFVHQALDRAIRGIGPLDAAAVAGDKQLDQNNGDVGEAIKDLIENHVRMAGAQGLLTNIGGLVTMAVMVPTNITGLALVQCRMVAAIAHLRGYDLDDKRTRNAILASLLGEERILALIKKKKLPGTPMALATAPVHDPHLDNIMANEVASELITKVAGKRLATTVGRRVPVVGGLVGAGTDGYSTWRVGRYVDREFLPRNRR